MSAGCMYVVDLDHVVYLVQAGLSRFWTDGTREGCGRDGTRVPLMWEWYVGRGERYLCRRRHAFVREGQAQTVGQMLWDENVRSVKARYPGCRGGLPKRDGLVWPADYGFRYPEETRRFEGFEPVQVLKACSCYVDQSGECKGWWVSEAKAYIDALRVRAYWSLPGYEGTAWREPEREERVE